jgi:hypothetical protein
VVNSTEETHALFCKIAETTKMVTFISASSYTPGGLNALTMEQITPYITTLSCIFHKKDNTFLINIYSLYKIRYE